MQIKIPRQSALYAHLKKSKSKQIYLLKLKDTFARQNIPVLIRAK